MLIDRAAVWDATKALLPSLYRSGASNLAGLPATTFDEEGYIRSLSNSADCSTYLCVGPDVTGCIARV